MATDSSTVHPQLEPFYCNYHSYCNCCRSCGSGSGVPDFDTNTVCGSRRPSAPQAHGSGSERSRSQGEDETGTTVSHEGCTVRYNNCSSRGWRLDDDESLNWETRASSAHVHVGGVAHQTTGKAGCCCCLPRGRFLCTPALAVGLGYLLLCFLLENFLVL